LKYFVRLDLGEHRNHVFEVGEDYETLNDVPATEFVTENAVAESRSATYVPAADEPDASQIPWTVVASIVGIGLFALWLGRRTGVRRGR
jgi:hypothetical protein